MEYRIETEILTEGPEDRKFDFDADALAQQVCAAVLTEENCPYDAQVFLLVTDEEEVYVSRGQRCTVLQAVVIELLE